MVLFVVVMTAAGPSAAQGQAQDAAERDKERREAIRALRDRPFGSMGTGSIMGSSGLDSALGTGGSIGSGTGRGNSVQSGGPDSSVLPASRTSPTTPPPIGVVER